MSEENQEKPKNLPQLKMPKLDKRGTNPNSLANLKPQVKGQPSHNPAGKPKGIKDRATVIREILKLEINPQDRSFQRFFNSLHPKNKEFINSVAQMIVLGQSVAAIHGNTTAAKWLWDQVYGKQDQTLNVKNVNVTELSDEELDRIIAGEGIEGEGEA